MKVDIIAYLKRNLKPDPDIDLTNELLEYVATLERKAKSLDKIRAAQKKYETRHPEKAKRYYEQNREERIKKTKQWRAEHPEQIKEYEKKRREKHKEKIREYMKQYRLRKKDVK